MSHFAVPIGGALPDAHGGEMRRLQRRHVPLVDAVIGNPVEPDLAVGPRLYAGPFDAIVEVLGLARREMIDDARRAAATAGVRAHAGVSVRPPFLRIDHFPTLVKVAGSGGEVGMFFGHALPRTRITILEGEALRIGAVAQDHGIAALLHRPKDVGPQHEAIVHLDRDFPVDAHAVAHFAAMSMGLARRCLGARIFNRSHCRPPVWAPSWLSCPALAGPTTRSFLVRAI